MSQLGLLGLGLPDVTGLDPFASPSLRAVFEPGASGALAEAAHAAEEGGERLSEVSSWVKVLVMSSFIGIMGQVPRTSPHIPILQPPFGPEDRPDGLEDSWWSRLLEIRDTRVQLEEQGDAAWTAACRAAAALDGVEGDEADVQHRVQEAYLRGMQLQEAGRRLEFDVLLTYRLTNGQVDLPEPAATAAWTGGQGGRNGGGRKGGFGLRLPGGGVAASGPPMSGLHALDGARILRLTAVERVNEAILERGADKVCPILWPYNAVLVQMLVILMFSHVIIM